MSQGICFGESIEPNGTSDLRVGLENGKKSWEYLKMSWGKLTVSKGEAHRTALSD